MSMSVQNFRDEKKKGKRKFEVYKFKYSKYNSINSTKSLFQSWATYPECLKIFFEVLLNI